MFSVSLIQRRCRFVTPSPHPSPPLGGRGEGEGGQPVIFLVGPTGSGKSEVSLRLARRLGCEIVSADSMQVYKGMDIGTAKPTPAERRKVPHHLIDFVSSRSNFSVFSYRQQALQAIEEILKRGRVPLVVGGSGLYIHAIWKGLSEIPGPHPKIRAPRGTNLKSSRPVSPHDELARIDPLRAAQIHPHDRRRILRALEIAKVSGKVPTDWYRRRESLEDLGCTVRVFGIARDRSALYERINQRVRTMFRKGFPNEVMRLRKTGFSKTARQALGYREMLECDPLTPTLSPFRGRGKGEGVRQEDLIQLIQKNTRHFAKRQLTWFRREKEIEWIPWQESESARTVCDKIVTKLNG